MFLELPSEKKQMSGPFCKRNLTLNWLLPLRNYKQSRIDSFVSFFLSPLSKDSPGYLHTDMDLCYAGSIEIAGDASLEELKMQVRCSPVLECTATLWLIELY